MNHQESSSNALHDKPFKSDEPENFKTGRRRFDWTQLPGPCPVCEGEGRVLKNAGLHSTGPVEIVACHRCDGTGEVVR